MERERERDEGGRIEWFPRFVLWVVESLVMPDWPDSGAAYWAELERLFAARRVTQGEATRVVRELYAGEPRVAFSREFPGAFLTRLAALRRADAARRQAELAGSAAATMGADAHQAECERVWATLDEPSRDDWRSLVRRRMPLLRDKPKLLETLAMAWCAFPSDIPPEPEPEPADFGPPLRHRDPKPLRSVFDHDRILDGPAPSPPESSDESTPV